MGSDLGVCANILRIILVIVNIFFVILGIILIALGSWLIATGDNYTFITGNSVIGGAALLIIAGIVTVIICATGIFGAIFKLRPILVVYSIVVAIIVILEIVAGILGFVFSGTVVEVANDRGLEAIRQYSVNPDSANPDQQDATQLVDFIQNTLNCCGYNNATDWINQNLNALLENQNVPPGYNSADSGCYMCNPEDPATQGSCMMFTFSNSSVNIAFNVTTTGCINRVQTNIALIASVTGAIGIVFGLLELTGVFFALFLCCCITSARRQEVV